MKCWSKTTAGGVPRRPGRQTGTRPPCFHCAGELDIAGPHELPIQLVGVEDDVVLDFAAVTFLDSSGVAAVIAERRRLRGTGHRLTLLGVHGAPRRTLEILGLLDDLT